MEGALSRSDPERTLAEFLAGLRIDAIPEAVQARTEDLFLDWIGAALAGKDARAVEAVARLALRMGPLAAPLKS